MSALSTIKNIALHLAPARYTDSLEEFADSASGTIILGQHGNINVPPPAVALYPARSVAPAPFLLYFQLRGRTENGRAIVHHISTLPVTFEEFTGHSSPSLYETHAHIAAEAAKYVCTLHPGLSLKVSQEDRYKPQL